MKNYRKYYRHLASPFVVGLMVTSFLTYASYLYYSRYQDSIYSGESVFFDLVREAHQKTIDYRMIMRGQLKGHSDVAVLAIDEASLEQEGRWPWPREKIGRVIESAVQNGAKVVAFDIIFSEPDSNSAKPTLARIKDALEQAKSANLEARALIETEIKSADSDKIFAEKVAKYSDNLVMGGYLDIQSLAKLEKTSPHIDSCLDVLYERSPAAKYWAHDQHRPKVTDLNADNQKLPTELRENLDTYLTFLEGNHISFWLGENTKIETRLQSYIAEVGLPAELPPSALIKDFIDDNPKRAAEGLSAALETDVPVQVVQNLFARFSSVIDQKQKAIILSKLRDGVGEYCWRFLVSNHSDPRHNDELLSEAIFKDRYPNPDVAGLFEQLAWKNVWKPEGDTQTSTFDDYLAKLNKKTLRNQITPIDRWWLNIPILTEATKYSAYFNAHLDSDGTVRRNMFMTRRGNNYFTSLALSAFMLGRNTSVAAVVSPLDDGIYKGIPTDFNVENVGVRLADLGLNRNVASLYQNGGFQIIDQNGSSVMNIPVDPSGHMLINYSGKEHSFPHISAADLLSERDDFELKVNPHLYGRSSIRMKKKDFLKDKILFFGATAIGIYDLRVTPFEENFPGVETHANMASNLLVEYARATGKGDSVHGMPGFLKAYPDREARFMLPLMVAFGIIFSALLTYFGSIAGLGITALAAGGVYGLDKFILFDSGIVITVLLPMSLIMSLFVTLTFYKYFTEERKKRQLKGTFAKYVSPAIVDEILADPENIELGGKKMELTVMFSDVRGFTTISEKLDPRALSDLLNSYLTPMTNLVFENKGTLDKYMGDAIMAFWGAPVHFNDHAKHASRCALQMLEKLRELQAQYKAQGLPSIDIGIGLNTGEMSVGNMGSDTVRSYTVMGDSVNLGSRLEGINKEYGTRIIISEFTHKEIADEFVCREIDWVRVKGKAQPVKIFELVGDKSTPERAKNLIAKFQEGFGAYHAKNWDKAISIFTECLHLNPEDEPSQLYLERCQEYKKNPPPADWDGVFTMTTK